MSLAPWFATTETTQATTPNIQAEWFTYDADNRVLVNDGSLVNGQIVLTPATYENTTYANQYDAAGNVVVRNTINADTTTVITGPNTSKTYDAGDVMSQRLVYDVRNEQVESDYATDLTQGESSLGAQQKMTYDADGHQLSVNTYYNGNSIIQVYGTHDMPNGYVYLHIGGWLSNGEVTAYNADGQVTDQVSYVPPDRNWLQVANNWENTGELPDGGQDAVATLSSDGPLAVGSRTTYTGFDHADNVTTYSYAQNPAPGTSGSGFGANYTVHYLKKDGYLEQRTTGTPTVSGYVPATDTTYYDAFGRNIAVAQTSEGNGGAAQNTTRAMAYDTAGQILEERSGTISGTTLTPTNGYFANHYTYVNGQQVSDMDEAGEIGVATTLTGFSSGAGTQGYVIQVGDTLASIAQAVYGNSQYGYIIGEANGLSSTSTLVTGQSITIPSVTTSSNTATTFKPYDPNQIVGSTTPNLPTAPPPPPSQAGCNALAAIVIIAVAIVVSVATYGAASGAMATWAGSSIGADIAATAIAGAAAAGAADAASQLAGDMLGTRSGFDFGEVLRQGLVGGVTAGIGAGTSLAFGSSATTALVDGAAGYAVNYEGNKIGGQPAHFSWAGLVASSVGALASSPLGATDVQVSTGQLGTNYVGNIEARAVGDVVDRETSVALGDNHVQSWQQVGEDVFGNALGNAAVAGINAYEANQVRKTTAFNASMQKIWDKATAATDNWGQGFAGQGGYSMVQTYAYQKGSASGGNVAGVFEDVEAGSGGASPTVNASNGAPATGAGQPVGGFPVMSSGDPTNQNDIDTLATQRANEIKYLNYVNGNIGGAMYPAPPDAGDMQANIEYGLKMQTDVYAAINEARNAVTVTASSALEEDAADAAAQQQSIDEFADGYRGTLDVGDFSFGDLIANTIHVLGHGGNSAILAGKSLYDVATDAQSRIQVVNAVGAVVLHPIDTYNRAVSATADFYGLSAADQATVLGDAAASFLATGGAQAGVGKVVGMATSYASDVAASLRSVTRADAFDTSFLEVPQGEVGVPVSEAPETVNGQWKYFYRGDATSRTSFLSSMAEEQGVPTATEFLDNNATNGFSDIYYQHGQDSAGLPTIGVSDDPTVAEYFARGPNQNQSGFVTVFRMSTEDAESLANRNFENSWAWSEINPDIGLPEREYLFHVQIDPKYIYQQYQVHP